MRLFHFIKGGCLVDNQHYQFSKQQVINRFRDGGEITFDAPSRRRTQPEHYDNRIWEFINSVSRDIANTLESKDKRADALVLFNDEEYEHNSDEGFISISGVDENNFTLRTGNLTQVYHPFKNSVSYHTVMTGEIGVWHYKCWPDAGLHERFVDASR